MEIDANFVMQFDLFIISYTRESEAKKTRRQLKFNQNLRGWEKDEKN